MNNYQKQKENGRNNVAALNAKLVAMLGEKGVKMDSELESLLQGYTNLFESTGQRGGESLLDLVMPNIGDSITKMDAFTQTEGRVVIDARQLYQWRRKGYNIESKDGVTYTYTSFDEEKNAAFLAAEKAKRDAKKSA